MKCLVYGAGSMGTVLGSLLARNGYDVTLVSSNKKHIDAMSRDGAQIKGNLELTQEVHAIYDSSIRDEYDLVFLMTKQIANREAISKIKKHMSKHAVVCSMQNGIPEIELREYLKAEQIIGAVATWSATMEAPGLVRVTSKSERLFFVLGSPYGGNDKQLNKIQDMLDSIGEVEITDRLLDARWSKMLITTAISAPAGCMNVTCGGITHNREYQSLALNILKETIDVGHAAGVHFQKVDSRDIAGELYLNDDDLESKRKKLEELFDYIDESVPSILQDIRNHKVTEVDYFNGLICRLGKVYGISTPFNEYIVNNIHKIESNYPALL